MAVADRCPLAGTLFDDLAKAIGDDSSGVLTETLQLFVEQFSKNVLAEPLLGIELSTRGRLEVILSRGGISEHVADVIAATIDIAKEVGAQGYAPVSGMLDDYVRPWLETVEAWLDEDHDTCPCTASVRRCLLAAQ